MNCVVRYNSHLLSPVDLAAAWDWLGSLVRPPETCPMPCCRSGRSWLLLAILVAAESWLLLAVLVAAWPRC